MSAGQAVIAALPWWIVTAFMAWRAVRSRDLEDVVPAAPPPGGRPLISVIVPARNEERNLERCARSVLASEWRELELILVDDHSTDRTGEIARRLASGDARVRVVTPPPLPDDWFGKQWACWTGYREARGGLLVFEDADTWQAPDLLPRAVAAMESANAPAITVGGRQEMHTFWERVVQGAMFSMLVGRFGGTEVVNTSPRAEDKIANGQFILFRRAAYEALGGHEAVREKVAEDLALAQRGFRMGYPILVVGALQRFSTRMYASLGEAVAGWSKNVWAGGVDAAPGGALGRRLLPLALLVPSLMAIVPPVAALLAAAGVFGPDVMLWGALATAPMLVWFAGLYRAMRQPAVFGLLFPLGSAVVLWIVVVALVRGRDVAWKGRRYRVAASAERPDRSR